MQLAWGGLPISVLAFNCPPRPGMVAWSNYLGRPSRPMILLGQPHTQSGTWLQLAQMYHDMGMKDQYLRKIQSTSFSDRSLRRECLRPLSPFRREQSTAVSVGKVPQEGWWARLQPWWQELGKPLQPALAPYPPTEPQPWQPYHPAGWLQPVYPLSPLPNLPQYDISYGSLLLLRAYQSIMAARPHRLLPVLATRPVRRLRRYQLCTQSSLKRSLANEDSKELRQLKASCILRRPSFTPEVFRSRPKMLRSRSDTTCRATPQLTTSRVSLQGDAKFRFDFTFEKRRGVSHLVCIVSLCNYSTELLQERLQQSFQERESAFIWSNPSPLDLRAKVMAFLRGLSRDCGEIAVAMFIALPGFLFSFANKNSAYCWAEGQPQQGARTIQVEGPGVWCCTLGSGSYWRGRGGGGGKEPKPAVELGLESYSELQRRGELQRDVTVVVCKAAFG